MAEPSAMAARSASKRPQTINLGAGPCALPTSVLEQASSDLLDFGSTGMGVTELSHRSKTFETINSVTQEDLRRLLQIPDRFDILFMQGGGLLQFSAVVMNLVNRYRFLNQTPPDQIVKLDYFITGSWSQKGAAEAERLGCQVNVVADSRKISQDLKSYQSIPESSEWTFSTLEGSKPAFVYYCDNETVDGVEFPTSTGFPISALPSDYQDVPIVSDMSSNLLTRSIPEQLWDRLGLIFAGAQKNFGPAGLTVVIVRKDLVDFNSDESVKFGGFRIPLTLIYKNVSKQQSLLNTPPMFSIYVSGLVLKDLSNRLGDIKAIEDLNKKKSDLIYDLIDRSRGFYISKVKSNFRSRINVVFNCRGGSDVEERMITLAQSFCIQQIRGHRSVGGIRFSLYNAITLEQVERLGEFMKKFMEDEEEKN